MSSVLATEKVNERRTDDDRGRLRYFADLLVFLHDLLDSGLGNSIDQLSTQAKNGAEYELLGISSAYFWPSSFLLLSSWLCGWVCFTGGE